MHVTRHTSHVTRHTSHVTRHTSHVTRHTSPVTRHTSNITCCVPHLPQLLRPKKRKSQIGRAECMSHVTRHTSHVPRHTSHAEHHTHARPVAAPAQLRCTPAAVCGCKCLMWGGGCGLWLWFGFRNTFWRQWPSILQQIHEEEDGGGW